MGMEPNPLMGGPQMAPEAGPPMDGGGMPPMGGPPMGMPQAPQPKPEWTDEALQMLMDDFDMDSMDIAIGADPKSVTDMQRMMRAQYLGTFLENPIMAAGMDGQEIKRRMLEAAQMDDIDKLFAKGPDPASVVAEAQAKATVKDTEAAAVLKMQQAEKARQDANDLAFNRGIAAGTVSNVNDPAVEKNRLDAEVKGRELEVKQQEVDIKREELALKREELELKKREIEINIELQREQAAQTERMADKQAMYEGQRAEREASRPKEEPAEKPEKPDRSGEAIGKGLEALAAVLGKPKSIVRGPDGKPTGIE